MEEEGDAVQVAALQFPPEPVGEENPVSCRLKQSLQSHLRCANIDLPKAPADVPLARSINLSHPSHSMIEPGLTNQRFSLRCCDMSLRFCPGVRVKSLASSRKICNLTQPTLIHPTYITSTSALRRAMIARRCHRSNAARYCDCHCGCIAADQKVNRSQLDEVPPAPPGFSPGWQ